MGFRSVVFVLALPVLSGLSACGGGSSPAAPSAFAQVGGLWTGTTTPRSVTGGECLAPLLANAPDRPRVTVEIQQTGSSLTATVTNITYGTSCTYGGSAGTTTISLSMQSCHGGKFDNIKCLNGDVRGMEVAGGAIAGTIDDIGIGGTDEQTWNTFVTGTAAPTGPMVISSALRLRRGPFVD